MLLNPRGSSLLWNGIDIAAYLSVGIALLAILRPPVQALGLSLSDSSRLVKWIYLILGVLCLLLSPV